MTQWKYEKLDGQLSKKKNITIPLSQNYIEMTGHESSTFTQLSIVLVSYLGL